MMLLIASPALCIVVFGKQSESFLSRLIIISLSDI
jgi:hypothetical protein